jgi:hypothetical protein
MAAIGETDRQIAGQPNPAGRGVDIGEGDASQGQQTGHIRWVLRISVVLAILALAAAWVWSAQTSHGVSPSQQVTPAGAPPQSAEPQRGQPT